IEIVGWWEPGDAAHTRPGWTRPSRRWRPRGCQAATQTCSARLPTRRSPAPTASTPPGSWPLRRASIPMGSSLRYGCQPRQRPRTGGPIHTTVEGERMATDSSVTAAAPPGARPRVVIVGAGFGGLECARRLNRAAADVLLMDRGGYHLFT